MDQKITSELKDRIQKIMDVLRNDLGTIRTGRAAPSLVENLVLSVYGGTTKMKVIELATVATTDAQTLVMTPFDPSIIQEIQKGVQETSAGLNPVIDGQIIRISIPPLSQERREELIKLMKHKLENGRVMVRQARHESMSDIKKMHTDKEITDDDLHRMEKEVQKIVDDTMGDIDSMGKQKEDELLQI
jgi:ribosome recycling factor